ncbi:hypothetical protein RFI_06612 [Reticulomyxa filosa]|uniref:Uncharacterized protein n=1 Tax=Reticulomyxa filosa TaxID=46433 RepID=X6NW33_RETFI|nr:hypothetical protein RFI_06612 [Reticulomyxa filosa]|eukprot:ETO30510.1 hypothetical protein RFI_06612 [Reticulomyxa filosa]
MVQMPCDVSVYDIGCAHILDSRVHMVPCVFGNSKMDVHPIAVQAVQRQTLRLQYGLLGKANRVVIIIIIIINNNNNNNDYNNNNNNNANEIFRKICAINVCLIKCANDSGAPWIEENLWKEIYQGDDEHHDVVQGWMADDVFCKYCHDVEHASSSGKLQSQSQSQSRILVNTHVQTQNPRQNPLRIKEGMDSLAEWINSHIQFIFGWHVYPFYQYRFRQRSKLDHFNINFQSLRAHSICSHKASIEYLFCEFFCGSVTEEWTQLCQETSCMGFLMQLLKTLLFFLVFWVWLPLHFFATLSSLFFPLVCLVFQLCYVRSSNDWFELFPQFIFTVMYLIILPMYGKSLKGSLKLEYVLWHIHPGMHNEWVLRENSESKLQTAIREYYDFYGQRTLICDYLCRVLNQDCGHIIVSYLPMSIEEEYLIEELPNRPTYKKKDSASRNRKFKSSLPKHNEETLNLLCPSSSDDDNDLNDDDEDDAETLMEKKNSRRI